MLQLSCNNLCVGYEKKVVQDNINFQLHSGDYLCIIGENGSGKSTLMKTLLGLLSPISGEIGFIGDVKPTEIGYLPQQTEIQRDFPASVWEVVLSGCLSRLGKRMFYTRAEKSIAKQNMEKLGITHLAKKSYSQLSGGQQQRTLLARALCAADKVLLLDEPVAGLDTSSSNEMYQTIQDLHKSGMTIIMISHDVETSLSYASHVLNIGSTITFLPKDEYVKSLSHEEGYSCKK